MGYGLNPVWWAFCSSFHGFWPCRPGHAAAGISWFVVDSVTFQHSRRSHQTPFHAFIDSLRHRPLPTLGGKVWKDYDGFGGEEKIAWFPLLSSCRPSHTEDPPRRAQAWQCPRASSQTTLSEADHSPGGQRFPDNSTNTAEFAEERTRLQKNNKLESTRSHVYEG